jgi:hypothetical protein
MLSSSLRLRLWFSIFPSGFLAFHISLTLTRCTACIKQFRDITFCQDSSCTKLAICRLADRSSILGMDFSSLTLSLPALGPSQTPIRLIPWVKRPERTGPSTSQLEKRQFTQLFLLSQFHAIELTHFLVSFSLHTLYEFSCSSYRQAKRLAP